MERNIQRTKRPRNKSSYAYRGRNNLGTEKSINHDQFEILLYDILQRQYMTKVIATVHKRGAAPNSGSGIKRKSRLDLAVDYVRVFRKG